MLVLGSGRKYICVFAERFDCTKTTINQLLVDSYQNPISEWQVMIKLHLVAGYMKPFPTSPCGPWKNCLPANWSLVPKTLRTTAPELLACPGVRLSVLLPWSKTSDRESQVFAKAGFIGC